MPKYFSGISKKAGYSPGAILHIGEKKTDEISITVINYNETSYSEDVVGTTQDAEALILEDQLNWITVTGLHDVKQIERIGLKYNIHPLVMEDVVNTHQRPKIETFEDYIYIAIKLPLYDEDNLSVSAEQISIILGDGYLLLFEESRSDSFKPIKDRLKNSRGRIRQSGSDYLAYAIVDLIVDCYFPVLEQIGEKIELTEEALIEDFSRAKINDLHLLKRELIHFRKIFGSVRELINRMRKDDLELVTDTTRVYLNDVFDHSIQIAELIDSYKDLLSGLTDLYLSMVGENTNQAMKVLTVIATIFIPMTFIVGVYGMNFKYMPELEWRWGYLFVWVLIIAVCLGMVALFKKKKLL